jgi:hypothetical protein
MTTSFGAFLENLSPERVRVLVAAEVAGARNGDGWFNTSDIGPIFEAFRVKTPANVRRELGILQSEKCVLSRQKAPAWSLTPRGRTRVKELGAGSNLDTALPELALAPGAELGSARHTVLPPMMAPAKWESSIGQMVNDYDFDSSVFCMTRFPKDLKDEQTGDYLDPVRKVIPAARSALASHGLSLHLASERQLDDDLFGNIAAHMWACRYGVALFENRLGRGLNENMLIEVGSMLITGRRCALLKDSSIDKMPTDFVGQIYKSVDFSNLESIEKSLHLWAGKDLGLGRCEDCPQEAAHE